jgi:hypothetical protein
MWRNKRIFIIKAFFWKEINKKENLPSIIYYFKKLSFFEIKRLEKLINKLKEKLLIKQKEQLFFINGTWIIRSTRRYRFMFITGARKKV